VDINPFQNPYAHFNENNDITKLLPQSGGLHLNRSKNFSGKIDERVMEIFAKNGFPIWGGNWQNPKDYHHFEILPNISQLLITMNKQDSQTFLTKSIEFYNKNQTSILESKQFGRFLNGKKAEEAYQASPESFMNFLSLLEI
jgi:hypothetical protein